MSDYLAKTEAECDRLTDELVRFKRALVESEERRAKLEKACEAFRDALDDALSDDMPATRKAMNELYADTIGAALDYTKGGDDE